MYCFNDYASLLMEVIDIMGVDTTNVDLSSWIEIVGRIYNVKISLEHGQATKNLLNGRLRYNESLEEAIEKMCFSTGWRYRKENGEYILLSKFDDDVVFEYHITIQDDDFNLGILTMKTPEGVFEVDFDEE